jgi:hypothetical protein
MPKNKDLSAVYVDNSGMANYSQRPIEVQGEAE